MARLNLTLDNDTFDRLDQYAQGAGRARSAIARELLVEALKAGNLKTKKATVNEALREFIQRRKQTEIFQLFGSIDFNRHYDHKKGRTRG